MNLSDRKKRKDDQNSIPAVMVTTFIISVVLCAAFGALYHYCEKRWMFSCAVTFGTIAYHLFIRFFSPVILFAVFHKKYDYKNIWFRQKSWEPKVYQCLRVKSWKRYIGSYDPGEFSLKKYSVEEVVNNMCHAEAVHELIIVLGFTSLLFAIAVGSFEVFLITAVIAGCAESIFIILQRYNRPRLVKILQKAKR